MGFRSTFQKREKMYRHPSSHSPNFCHAFSPKIKDEKQTLLPPDHHKIKKKHHIIQNKFVFGELSILSKRLIISVKVLRVGTGHLMGRGEGEGGGGARTPLLYLNSSSFWSIAVPTPWIHLHYHSFPPEKGIFPCPGHILRREERGQWLGLWLSLHLIITTVQTIASYLHIVGITWLAGIWSCSSIIPCL